MRDRLLRDDFHYDSQDIEAFEKRSDVSFIIGDAGKCSAAKINGLPCEWAKPEDINNWEKSGNSVAITLPADKIKDLQDFRQGRVIDKAVAEISDPALRENVKKDLLQAATGNGQDRTDAAGRLMNLDNPNKADLDKARQAVKAVAEQPENRNNSLTMLVAGKIKLDEIAAKLKGAAQKAGPVDSEKINQSVSREIFDAEYQIEKAAKLASGVDNLTGKVDVSKINRKEAVWVNQQAASILEQTGQTETAAYREQIGRFFEVDDTERKSHLANGVIDRWQVKSHASMEASTIDGRDAGKNQTHETTERKVQFVLKEDPFKREWKVPSVWGEDKLLRVNTDPKSKEAFSTEPLVRYNIRGSLLYNGTVKIVEERKFVDENGKPVRLGQSPFYKNDITVNRTFESAELSSRGTVRAAQVGGATAIISFVNNNTPLWADLYYHKTENKIALMDKMEKADFDSSHYRIPPRPEELSKEREKLVRMFGASKEMEVKVNQMMNGLEEQSHAYWGR